MDTDSRFPLCFCFLHHSKDFFQCHASTVVHLTIRLAVCQHRGIHQRTGINNCIGVVDQPLAFDCQQFWITGTGTYKIYHLQISSLDEQCGKI